MASTSGSAARARQSVVTPGDAVALGQPAQGRLAPGGRRHQLGVRVLEHRPGVEVHDPAGPDQRDPHPLTPVRVTPSTNTFRARKKITSTGSVNRIEAAIWRLARIPRESWVSCWREMARVQVSGLLPAYSRGLKKSFQQ
jgi:hypothetical protein